MRQAHHHHIQRLFRLPGIQPGRQGIFVINVHRKIGHHSEHLLARKLLKLNKPRAQQRCVAPEFIDDQSRNARTLHFFQQSHRTVELGKYAAPVDVPSQQHRCIHRPGQAHIHNVVRLQINLCRLPAPSITTRSYSSARES